MDFLLIALLTLLNGVFAMSELALASSRKLRLVALAEEGDKGAQAALALLDDPTQFLSSVQVGITSIGMLNGIIGEAAFSERLAHGLQGLGVAPGAAGVAATALVITVITFITIVFGELVPKRIGQLYPEPVARVIAQPMTWVARVAKPFVRLLALSTQAVLRLLRVDDSAVRSMTEEEIIASLEEGRAAGVIEHHEHQMVRNVFHLDDRPLTSLMVPRTDVQWLDARASVAECLRLVAQGERAHSWYPVCRGSLDEVVGVIGVARLLALGREASGSLGGCRTLGVESEKVPQRDPFLPDSPPHSGTMGQEDGKKWAAAAHSQPTIPKSDRLLEAHVQPAVFVPETLTGMELLDQFRKRAGRMVFVVDEYGVVQGIMTPHDLLEAITGELQPGAASEAWATQREDGSWLLDGLMPVNELKARLGIRELPDEERARYNTLAGLLLAESGHLPVVGERIGCAGWVFEVVDLDGKRIDKVLAQQPPPASEQEEGGYAGG